jgi:Holliday junction resolvase
MPINSRQKGARGEREWRDQLRNEGFDARRGQQFAGGTDSPDVICESLPGIHWEVKRVERGNPYEWMEQAERDAGTKMPVVAHKRNGKDWICIMSAESLFALIRETNQPLIIREIQSSNSQSASGVADATP